MTVFAGAAVPLSESDVARAAQLLGVDEAAVRAVIEVEAASYGFDARGRPRILFEPHIFWRELGPGILRSEAKEAGLAYPRWRRDYPRTMDARYAQLARAIQIDRTAALKSASWGLGQIMGFNYRLAGFDTVDAFVAAMKESEGAHLMAMAQFIKNRGLDGALRRHDWAAFARGYNGPGYAKNKYDARLARAHAKHADKRTDTRPLLRRGVRSGWVSTLQLRLNAHGFSLVVDGVFGDETHLAVVAFQERAGLLTDGVVGKATWAALDAQPAAGVPDPDEALPAPADVDRQAEAVSPVKEAAKTPEGKGGIATGIGGVGTVLTDMGTQIQPLLPYADALRWVFLALMLGGIAVTTYALLRRSRR